MCCSRLARDTVFVASEISSKSIRARCDNGDQQNIRKVALLHITTSKVICFFKITKRNADQCTDNEMPQIRRMGIGEHGITAAPWIVCRLTSYAHLRNSAREVDWSMACSAFAISVSCSDLRQDGRSKVAALPLTVRIPLPQAPHPIKPLFTYDRTRNMSFRAVK